MEYVHKLQELFNLRAEVENVQLVCVKHHLTCRKQSCVCRLRSA